MKRVGVNGKNTSVALISAFVILFGVSAFPSGVFALDAISKTSQLLPPGQNTCPAVTVSNFTPYIYGGSLDSFEFTISDPAYVAVAAQTGNTSIPFKFMTRRIDSSGVLHIRAELESTPVYGSFPVSVTLLSAAQGQPVCATVVAVMLEGSATAPVTPPPAPTPTPSTPKPSTGTQTPTPTPKPSTSGGKGTQVPGTTTSTSTTGTSSTMRGNVQSTLEKICTTSGGAVRLWTVLLAVYLLIIAATILAQPPVAPNAQSASLLALAIIVPLLALLGVWYFSHACRVGIWIPILSIIIALAGFLLGFRNHPRVAAFFTLPK